MKLCTHCNQEFDDSLNICSHCGSEFAETTHTQTLLYKENDLDFKKLAIQPLYKYFDLKGRATRTEYWGFFLFSMVLNFVQGMFFGILGGLTQLSTFSLLSSLVSLILVIPSITVSVRRLHDIDRSGWYLLIPSAFSAITLLSILFFSIQLIFLPLFAIGAIGCFVSSFYLLFLFCNDSDKETNKYGPSEKYTRV